MVETLTGDENRNVQNADHDKRVHMWLRFRTGFLVGNPNAHNRLFQPEEEKTDE